MFIPIALQENRQPAGRAAFFCPVCRELRAATAVRWSRTLLGLFIIPIWSWPLRIELTCPTCQVEVRRGAEYPCSGSDTEDSDIDPLDLLELVDDELFETLTTRAELERTRHLTRLRPEQRRELLAEPFLEFDHRSAEVAHTNIPTGAGIGIVLLVFAVPVTILMFVHLADWLPKLIASLICLLLVAVITVDLTILEPKRRCGSVYARLAQSLAPLGPSDIELSETIATLRTSSVLARRVRVSQLRRELDQLAAQQLIVTRL